jgi:hypothetical protein
MGRLAARDGHESEVPERRSHTREHVERTARPRNVDWICLPSRRIGALGRFQCLDDHSRHNVLKAAFTPWNTAAPAFLLTI